jgi:hypothetical protein
MRRSNSHLNPMFDNEREGKRREETIYKFENSNK